MPTVRELLMNARAEGRNAKTLTAYQKKVRSLEALERKLQRQMEAMEAAKEGTDCHTVGRHAHMPPEDGGAIKGEGSLPTIRNDNVGKVGGVLEQIRKTEASIARADHAGDQADAAR